MANLSETKRNGKTCYQIWVGSGTNRKNIWLGNLKKWKADEILPHVRRLEIAQEMGTTLEKATIHWLRGIDDRLLGKLVKAGLAEPRSSLTVREFFAERLSTKTCAARTRDIYQRAHKKFFEFLGSTNPLLRDVTPRQASDFYEVFLKEAGMAESYRAKTAKIVREFFGKAVKLKLIESNPFDGFIIKDTANRDRHVYIDRDCIHQFIRMTPDLRWKCLLGFAGLCGLRSRSEIAAMRWEFINWDESTFTVPKAKTKERTVPVFGDFRNYLEIFRDACVRKLDDPFEALSGPIFPNCPSQTQLTNRLKRTISKAGMQPWPKPWMNLRSSVETHLVREGFDLTTVSGWLGNSPAIAQKHYLQVTPGDISKASALTAPEFSNSFQNLGESASTPKEKPAFPSMQEQGNAGQYTPEDSNL